MIITSEQLLREYIKSIAFPASNIKHRIFVYRAGSNFPYKFIDDDSENKLTEDDMIYVLRPKSSKNMAGSKRGWSSPPVPISTKEKKKKYFSLKSLINTEKKF